MKSRLRTRAGAFVIFAALVLLALPAIVAAQEQVILDWEEDAAGNPIQSGQVIDDEYHAMSGVSVTVKVESRYNIAAIFPSHNPPVGPNGVIDPDLGSPNETCDGGGPGIGEGGEVGQPGENCLHHENVLIIPTIWDRNGDGFIDGLPDDDANGGTITLLFSEEVIIDYAGILDQEFEEALTINAYADIAGTQLLVSENPAGFGDNSYEEIAINALGARRIDFVFAGSGAIASVAYTPVTQTAIDLAGFTASSIPAGLYFALAVAALAIFSVVLVALRYFSNEQ
ncbi:MAG TPA: hypothetical protein VK879_13530 [Candidatus Sulfomarinibacteraceae bacterium]|nr:hypothetical protein [Candidatus Sulfomarinibacteraceae bacterium]